MSKSNQEILADEQRLARYFEASEAERAALRQEYAAQVAGELALAKARFEEE